MCILECYWDGFSLRSSYHNGYICKGFLLCVQSYDWQDQIFESILLMSHKIYQVFFSFYGNIKYIEYIKSLSIIFCNTLLVEYGIKSFCFMYSRLLCMKWPWSFWCSLVFEVQPPLEFVQHVYKTTCNFF